MAPQIVVKFHARHGVYCPNEKAHFPKIVADQLIKAGVASYVGEAGLRKSDPAYEPVRAKK
ncbi:MAG: hypothetical protein PHR30_16425 [Gallionellaceae bacterium]|nr:hypothetical protein [Gallionellaceae bacterium]